MDYRYYVGVDPDTEKSGVAVWDKYEQQFIFILSIDFWTLIEFLKSGYLPKIGQMESWSQTNFHVTIDAGWLIKKTNFHQKQGPRIREKMSMAIGRNHQVGINLMEYCMRYGLNYTLHEPSGKIPAPTFKKITNWQNQTNQDSRDAAMLVFKK